MAKDIFGGLGGLMKGLGAFMPQDDPNTKIFTLQSDLSDLKERETELYAQIGKKAFDSICKNANYTEIVSELETVQQRLVQTQDDLHTAQIEKENKEKAEEEKRSQFTCPQCGIVFEEGLKFCNECGCKLGVVTKVICARCKSENSPETRFCGECGNKLS